MTEALTRSLDSFARAFRCAPCHLNALNYIEMARAAFLLEKISDAEYNQCFGEVRAHLTGPEREHYGGTDQTV